MNNCYDDLILLISQWKDFREVQPQGDISNFASWILKETPSVPEKSEHENFIVERASEMEEIKNSSGSGE